MSTRLNRVLGPIFSALYPVPKIAILPLILLFFGIGEMSKYVVVAIGVFFLMFYNTLRRAANPQIYLDVAQERRRELPRPLRGSPFPRRCPASSPA